MSCARRPGPARGAGRAAEAGRLRSIADRLGVSQPTASEHLKLLDTSDYLCLADPRLRPITAGAQPTTRLNACYNQTLCRVGDVIVRLGVMHGEYHWHKHGEQDEFLSVLGGQFRIATGD